MDNGSNQQDTTYGPWAIIIFSHPITTEGSKQQNERSRSAKSEKWTSTFSEYAALKSTRVSLPNPHELRRCAVAYN